MTTRAKRSDLTGWITVAVLCIPGVAYLLGGMLFRMSRILGNHDVPITVPFQNTSTDLALGDATTHVVLTDGVIHVSGLTGLTYVSVLIGEILESGAPVALLVLLGVFALRMARARVFDRTNSRLVTWAGIVVLLGWGLGAFFAHMGVNGSVPDSLDDAVASRIDLFPIAIGAALLLFGVVFEAGMRMKRDTEGLV
jgi:hypothetical protein